MKGDFLWLQQWFQDHCNGNWEYDRRIQLSTLDNPGWSLEIDLKDTELANTSFQEIKDIGRSKENWKVCKIRSTKFDAVCGIENLPEVLKAFRHWVENEPFDSDSTLENTQITENSMEEDDFLWLQEWYQSYCDENWEHSYGIQLRTTDTPGWSLTIDLENTELEYADFQQIKIDRSEEDWIFCEINKNKFEAKCGVGNLPEILKIFRYWAIENEPSGSNEYMHEDSVIVRKDAPKQFFPGKTGVVTYMWEIKREETAREYYSELGDWLYVVKFGYNNEILIAGRFLERYPEE